MAKTGDYALRAMTDDGAFRVITLRTTELTARAVGVHAGGGEEGALLADLLTGAVLVRETMSPSLRVELVLSTPSGAVVADSQPTGHTRGLIDRRGAEDSVGMGDGGQLKVVRRMPRGEPHQSVIGTGRGDTVSDALMAYMQTSEQIFSVIVTQSLLSDAGVVSSGGFIVQLLPECGRGPLMLMTERLGDFQDLGGWLQDVGAAPDALMSEILYGMTYTVLQEDDISFGCEGGEARALNAVSSLGPEELGALIEQEEELEVACHYCKHTFAFSPAQVKGLLQTD